jgi:hypothetical protein
MSQTIMTMKSMGSRNHNAAFLPIYFSMLV